MAKKSDLSKKLTQQNRARAKAQGGIPSEKEQEAALNKLTPAKMNRMVAELGQAPLVRPAQQASENEQFPSMVTATQKPPEFHEAMATQSGLQMSELNANDSANGGQHFEEMLQLMREQNDTLRSILDVMQGDE